MTEHMVRYMQKKFYEGLTEKDSLKSDAMLEWFNNNGVFMEDENNFLCNKCPLTDCIECDDIISALNRAPGKYLSDIYDDIIYNILYRKLVNQKEIIISYVVNKYKD